MNINNDYNNFLEKFFLGCINELSIITNKEIEYLGKIKLEEISNEELSMTRSYFVSIKDLDNSEKILINNSFKILYKEDLLKKIYQYIFNDNGENLTTKEVIDFGKEFTEIITNKYFENPYDKNLIYNPNTEITINEKDIVNIDSLKIYFKFKDSEEIDYFIFDLNAEIDLNIEEGEIVNSFFIEEDNSFTKEETIEEKCYSENEIEEFVGKLNDPLKEEINTILEDDDEEHIGCDSFIKEKNEIEEIDYGEVKKEHPIIFDNKFDIEDSINNLLNAKENPKEENIQVVNQIDNYKENKRQNILEDNSLIFSIEKLSELKIGHNLGGLNLSAETIEKLLLEGIIDNEIQIPLTLNLGNNIIKIPNTFIVIDKELKITIKQEVK